MVPPHSVRPRDSSSSRSCAGILRHEPRRAQLGVGVPGLADLVEVLLPADLVLVAVEPHAPRVGGGTEGELLEGAHQVAVGKWKDEPLSCATSGQREVTTLARV